MGIFSYGDVEYDIEDCKIARWNGDGTYGSLIDVPAIDMARIEFTMKQALGRGDGGLKLVASAIEAANITMRNFGIVATSLPVLFGASNDEYNPGADAYTINDMVAGQVLPYFGMAIRSFDNESVPGVGHQPGGALIFVPKIKVTANFQWNFAYNTFIQPELTGFGLVDDNLPSNVGVSFGRFVRVKRYKRDLPLLSAFPF